MWLPPPILFLNKLILGIDKGRSDVLLYFSGLEKYPSGRRGSPAKGVAGVEPGPGSNPGFSASEKPCNFNGYRVFSMSEKVWFPRKTDPDLIFCPLPHGAACHRKPQHIDTIANLRLKKEQGNVDPAESAMVSHCFGRKC